VFLEVGEGCGLGDRDGVGLAGLPGGDLVAAPGAGEAVDKDGVEVPGLIPEAGVEGERPACPGDKAPGGEVVDAEQGDVAFARGGAEVAAGAPFDDPGGEPGVFQGGVWVPETASPYATCAYSRMMPPRRSRRRTRMLLISTGGWRRPAGGSCCSDRCGRCPL